MLYLITGGSGSGKSEYAEKLAEDRHKNKFPEGKLYYVATMYPFDEECLKRIEKHRKMRKEKGFATIECYCGLEQVAAGSQDVVLLECMSNLLANEMYQEEGRIKDRGDASVAKAEEAILKPVFELAKQAGCVVIVSNEVFSDGVQYDRETELYLKLLGRINQGIAAGADGVIEVVCSVPVYGKGERVC